MKSKYVAVFLPVLRLLWISAGCDYDHGIDPIRTKISGEITFVGSPPGNISEVRVAVAKRFPPVDLTQDLLYSEQLPKNQTTVRYEILAAPGTYAATGVLWRRSGEAWTLSNLLALYTVPLSFSPAPVTVPPATQPQPDAVNMSVDWELAKRDAYIEGDITFAGAMPLDTEIMAIAMFPIIPRTQFEFLTVKALDLNVPLGVQRFHYRTPVASGEYKFVSVFWKGKSGSIFDVRAIGFYRSAADTTKPGSVTVASGGTATGINLVADFNTLPAGVQY
jgi:hypothetical protein